MSEQWQEDWVQFCEVLQECLNMDSTLDSVAFRFGGKEVIWEGMLESKDFDELSPGVYIRLPEYELHVGEGRLVLVDGIALPVSDNSIKAWNELKDGEAVTFRARMGRGEAPFPPVSLKTFESGKTIITIRLCEGIPLR